MEKISKTSLEKKLETQVNLFYKITEKIQPSLVVW